MNIARPLVAVLLVLAANLPSLLQIAGLALLVAACGMVWGAVGAVTAAGVALTVAGVALERGE